MKKNEFKYLLIALRTFRACETHWLKQNIGVGAFVNVSHILC